MDDFQEEEGAGRWTRARRPAGGRLWLRLVLVTVVVPILIGAGVVLIGGRSLGFEIVRRLTVRKFPELRWVDRAELARWRQDPGRPQPLVLDARSAPEYQVSGLRDAVWINPQRPSLHAVAKLSKDAPIVVYSSVGYRGARVAHWLAGQGYANVQNLTGGIFQWADEGRPVFRNGRPTTEVHRYDQRWGLLLVPRYRSDVPDVSTPFKAP
jgi:rhodanese-related sulfurtransferase